MSRHEYDFVSKNLGAPPKRVLEVGCGESKFPLDLARKGFEVYCVDISPQIKHDDVKLRYKCEDARNLSFPNSFFDVVYSVSTVEHVGLSLYPQRLEEDGDRKAILEMWRVLKPNGCLLVTVPVGVKDAYVHGLGKPTGRRYNESKLRSLFDGLDYKEFQVVEWWLLTNGESQVSDEKTILKQSARLREMGKVDEHSGDVCLRVIK